MERVTKSLIVLIATLSLFAVGTWTLFSVDLSEAASPVTTSFKTNTLLVSIDASAWHVGVGEVSSYSFKAEGDKNKVVSSWEIPTIILTVDNNAAIYEFTFENAGDEAFYVLITRPQNLNTRLTLSGGYVLEGDKDSNPADNVFAQNIDDKDLSATLYKGDKAYFRYELKLNSYLSDIVATVPFEVTLREVSYDN